MTAFARRSLWQAPRPSLRFVPVWRRNFLVWKKLAAPSILGNLADPMIYMLGLGYGLGAMLPQVGGVSYIAFLAAGTVCFSTMNCATFEALYSAFSRMHVQKTWDAILNAPLDIQSQELSVKQRENALTDAKEKLADYFIRALFDGVVAKVSVKKGDSVSSGSAVANWESPLSSAPPS